MVRPGDDVIHIPAEITRNDSIKGGQAVITLGLKLVAQPRRVGHNLAHGRIAYEPTDRKFRKELGDR